MRAVLDDAQGCLSSRHELLMKGILPSDPFGIEHHCQFGRWHRKKFLDPFCAPPDVRALQCFLRHGCSITQNYKRTRHRHM
jgi:hypothetical protein